MVLDSTGDFCTFNLIGNYLCNRNVGRFSIVDKLSQAAKYGTCCVLLLDGFCLRSANGRQSLSNRSASPGEKFRPVRDAQIKHHEHLTKPTGKRVRVSKLFSYCFGSLRKFYFDDYSHTDEIGGQLNNVPWSRSSQIYYTYIDPNSVIQTTPILRNALWQ